jgi:hypothetical protein
MNKFLILLILCWQLFHRYFIILLDKVTGAYPCPLEQDSQLADLLLDYVGFL